MVLSGSSPIHRLLGSFECVPEVRTLPSTDITRLHKYYDPLRLPPQPPVQITVLGLTQPRRVSPVARITFPACRAHYPGGSNGCACRLLPRPRGLPRFTGGRHPRLHFRGLLRLHSRYGPPGCSTAQGGLCHEASVRPVTQQDRSSATRLSTTVWVDSSSTGHPCLFGAHSEIREVSQRRV